MYFPTGYRMMFDYLDSLYQRTRADELGGLLGCMSLLGDGEPANPAYGPDWKRAVRQAETALGQGFPPSELAYESMLRFLQNWAAAGSDGTVSDICACLAVKREWKLWDECVRRVLKNEDSMSSPPVIPNRYHFLYSRTCHHDVLPYRDIIQKSKGMSLNQRFKNTPGS